MKVKTVGVVLVLLLLSGAVQAGEKRGFYVGLGAGRSELESRAITSSIPPQTQVIKGNATSVRLFGGYRIFRFLFIEAGLASYGDFSESLDSGSDAPSYEVSFAGWDAALVGNLPLAKDRVGLFVKIGVARNSYDTLIFDPNDASVARDTRLSESQNTAMAGVGAQVNLGANKNHGLRIEYNVYEVSLLAVDQSNIFGSYVYRF